MEALAIAGGATEDGGETGNAPLTTDESVEPPTNTAAPSTVTAVKPSRAKKATKPKAVQVDDNDDDDNATKKPRKARAAATKKKASQIDDDDDENEGKDDADDDDDAELDDDADEDDDEEGGNGKKKRGKTATKPRASRKKTSAPSVAAAAVLRKATTSITASQRAALDPAVIAQNLVGLLSGAPLAVRTSLEEVLSLCTSRGLIPNGVVSCLWDTVAYGVATLARTRIAVANTLAQQQRAVAAAVAATAATTTTMSSVSS